jgi:hypothetical protein
MIPTTRQRTHEKRCRWLRCQYNDHRLDGPISEECYLLDGDIDRIEDDRLHAEAEKLRRFSATLPNASRMDRRFRSGIRKSADLIDPYTEHQGRLVRKKDGRPVDASKDTP